MTPVSIFPSRHAACFCVGAIYFQFVLLSGFGHAIDAIF